MSCVKNLDFGRVYNETDLDSSSGCELSFEMSHDNDFHLSPIKHELSMPKIVTTCSPPYKRVRALRLFDTPLTPKTIIENSSLLATPQPVRTRLFSRGIPSAYPKKERLSANVNPFTHDGLLNTRKRTRSLLASPEPTNLEDCDLSDIEIEQPTKHFICDSNISRYVQEFVELEEIGQGQFGSVFKCINRLDGCIYAIKKSTKPVAGSVSEKQALNEVYAHAVLGRHQHVVRYYSAWAEDNHMIIQNEYCSGGSLSEKISQETLSPFELRQLILQVAEGLRYIHSEGLVHLDIKPANIFMSKEKKVQYTNYDSADDGFEDLDESSCEEEQIIFKIGDLGHVTSIQNPQVEDGDCRYLPKELLNDDYTNLPKADVFAFGLSILEAAGSGPLPKNGPLWHKLREPELPPLPQVLNRDFVDLIKSMIHPDPVQRPTPLQIIQHRAVCPAGNKTRAQLYRELNAEKLKNEILSKQLVDAATCIKTMDNKNIRAVSKATSRLIGKKINRSFSTTTF